MLVGEDLWWKFTKTSFRLKPPHELSTRTWWFECERYGSNAAYGRSMKFIQHHVYPTGWKLMEEELNSRRICRRMCGQLVAEMMELPSILVNRLFRFPSLTFLLSPLVSRFPSLAFCLRFPLSIGMRTGFEILLGHYLIVRLLESPRIPPDIRAKHPRQTFMANTCATHSRATASTVGRSVSSWDFQQFAWFFELHSLPTLWTFILFELLLFEFPSNCFSLNSLFKFIVL